MTLVHFLHTLSHIYFMYISIFGSCSFLWLVITLSPQHYVFGQVIQSNTCCTTRLIADNLIFCFIYVYCKVNFTISGYIHLHTSLYFENLDTYKGYGIQALIILIQMSKRKSTSQYRSPPPSKTQTSTAELDDIKPAVTQSVLSTLKDMGVLEKKEQSRHSTAKQTTKASDNSPSDSQEAGTPQTNICLYQVW